MQRFAATSLHRALDAERSARGLSWQELSRQIGVSASTMQRLAQGRRLEVDGMLAMVVGSVGLSKVLSLRRRSERSPTLAFIGDLRD